MKPQRLSKLVNSILVTSTLLVSMGISAAHVFADSCSGGNLQVTVGTPGLQNLCNDGNGSSPVYSLLSGISNWVVGIIGGVAVLVIIISAIQMITSAGNPELIKAAKKRLINTVVALFLLVAMRVILNLVIAGGGF